MRKKPGISPTPPVIVVLSNSEDLDDLIETAWSSDAGVNRGSRTTMSDVNGVLKEQIPPEGILPPHGRVVSASMIRSVMSSSESAPSAEPTPWSSAIGHAGTGKSGRVIERLQGDIDKLRREKQLLKTRHEETEKANEALAARNQSLQDRNSNFEQSHEASLRQLARRERQVEDLREELRKEKAKTAQAEAEAQAAAASEETWREQASQAKALAAQKEAEYDTVVACRKMDCDRQQGGLDKIRGALDGLVRRQEDDEAKRTKLEIIAEQQKQTIAHLEDLTRRLSTNFRAYRQEIDTAIAQLRGAASSNDAAVTQKLDEMTDVTARMRWVMNVEQTLNHRPRDPAPLPNGHGVEASDPSSDRGRTEAERLRSTTRPAEAERLRSPTEGDGLQSMTGADRRTASPTKGRLIKHRRKGSTKVHQ